MQLTYNDFSQGFIQSKKESFTWYLWYGAMLLMIDTKLFYAFKDDGIKFTNYKDPGLPIAGTDPGRRNSWQIYPPPLLRALEN